MFEVNMKLSTIMLTLLVFSAAKEEREDLLCANVDSYIQQYAEKLRIEKESSHTDPYTEIDPQGINAVVEVSGDVQRTIEYLDEMLNISESSEFERKSLEEKLADCPSFQALLSECKGILTEPECDPSSPYRTYDGTCNNLQHRRWGSLYAEYRRILPPNYKGIYGYRESVLGGPLPDPRHLSYNLLQRGGESDKKLSQMFMFFGQLVSHDTTDAPTPKVNGRIPRCCVGEAPGSEKPWCDPIRPEGDPFYSQFHSPCIMFYRHPPHPNCQFGKRQHMNGVPSFLDLHMTYGRSEAEAKQLRANDGTGRLKVQVGGFGDLMPANISEDDQACFFAERCFLGADSRTNQHTTLMVLETLMLKEHNRLADQLRRMNAHWGADRIYHVTRKIMGAKMQVLTYNEYLPLLLGTEAMEKFNLKIGGSSKNYYDQTLVPNVVHEFATIGFRFHNTVNTLVGKSGCSKMKFRDTNSNPEPLHAGCMGNFLKQTAEVPQQQFGCNVITDMTNYFFRQPYMLYGVDLAATNIKRGREHGMPTYSELASYVYGKEMEDFEDLKEIIPDDKIDLLKAYYRNVKDVDPWVGMVMEEPVSGAMVGRTSFNLTVDHFVRVKHSDRFYFENQGQPNSFTAAQIKELMKTTLSKLICDNTKVRSIHPYPFLLPGPELIYILLLVIDVVNSAEWSPADIDKIIEDFNDQLKLEKKNVPTGYAKLRDSESFVLKAEKIGDVQRTFETIAEKINYIDLSEEKKADVSEILKETPAYQDLVSKCEATHHTAICDPDSPYRTYDGTCNNLKNPFWGASLTCYERLLPQIYQGVNSLRTAVSGNPLPNARDLSVAILKNTSRPDKSISHMFTFFGQLVAHDITSAPHAKLTGAIPQCCSPEFSAYPECAKIVVRDDDPFYSQFQKTCLQFVRRTPCTTCQLGLREQTNFVSSFIDLHSTYGRTEKESKDLRALDGTGRLKVQKSEFGDLMSSSTSEDDVFCPVGKRQECFKGGDGRINQHALLMTLNTLFVREHNRLADELAKINAHWEDEEIFQTARQINVAQHQNVVYKEFLPLLLGPELMDEFGLWVWSPYTYDEALNPSARNEFTAFAFRLHNLLNTQVGRRGCANVKLRDILANSSIIHQGCLNSLLEETCHVPAQMFDSYFIDDVTEFINRKPHEEFGLDLAALNIMRGRDHGMPPYADFPTLWSRGELQIDSFDNLTQIMSQENIDLLKDNYENVRDVDAFIGAQLEDHIPGSPVGATVAYITALQFHNLKHGDRFFYQNADQFTVEQIQSLLQSSLSKLICDNTDAESMPRDAFLEPSPWNYMPCSQLPPVNLNLWKETDNS